MAKKKNEQRSGKPLASDLPTPPSGTRVMQKRPSRWRTGCTWLLGACVVFSAFSVIGQRLGFIPDPTESAQTQAARLANTNVAAFNATSNAQQAAIANAIPTDEPPTETPEPTATPEPMDAPTVEAGLSGLRSVTVDGGMTLSVESIEVLTEGDRRTPANGVFLVLYAQLENSTSRRQCIYARDVRLILDGESYAPNDDAMDDVQGMISPQRDYIGPILGQCVDAGETSPTFAVFDVRMGAESATLRVNDNEIALDVSQSSQAIAAAPTPVPTETERSGNTAASLSGLFSTNTPQGAVAPTATITDTPEPEATNTRRPTATDEPTNTPRPTEVPAATPASDVRDVDPTTYYAQGGVNLRSCPQTTCDRVGQLASGTAIIVDGVVNGEIVQSGNAVWYRTEYNNREAYVYSGLVTSSPPVVNNPPSNNNSSSNTSNQPISTAAPSGATCPGNYTCSSGQMTCQQAYACLAAGNGSLDRDNDGVPCEDICPGG